MEKYTNEQRNADGDTFTPADRTDELPLVIIGQGDQRTTIEAQDVSREITQPMRDLVNGLVNGLLLGVTLLGGVVLVLWVIAMAGSLGGLR